ncbi:hypothetical protein DWB61_17460 [Ancylomarina euxinus]|uniref:Uncharacterized protein n=1 Tax=Ancylomarina euxinus TaxID=2283627 RepID=A0A425XWG3_9BACT|nr:hypothetical protein [Ancylomarina euxinus]MCZ4696450.1 hypothetical protein [Ancylomarina euxinus]RRG18975.1 hypothetical protein DWB61_17460 [Ancylomarina euxinus]
MKHYILIITFSLLKLSTALGQSTELPPMLSNLDLKNVQEIEINQYHVYKETKYHQEKQIIAFNETGKVVLNKRIFLEYDNNILKDTFIYDKRDRLIKSLRYRPNDATIESSKEYKFEKSGKLLDKEVFDEQKNLIYNSLCDSASNNFRRYVKESEDGDKTITEFIFNKRWQKDNILYYTSDTLNKKIKYNYSPFGKKKSIITYSKGINEINRFEYYYDKYQQLIKEVYTDTTNFKKNTEGIYERDKYGNLVLEIHRGSDFNWTHKYVYKYNEKGTWTERTYYRSDLMSRFITLNIKYYKKTTANKS